MTDQIGWAWLNPVDRAKLWRLRLREARAAHHRRVRGGRGEADVGRARNRMRGIRDLREGRQR